MPNYDRKCTACDWTAIDQLRAVAFVWPACPDCGADTEPLWTQTPSIVPDEIIGGRWVENLGPNPVKVHSRSELRRMMHVLGVEEFVRHQPEPGTDKSKHTTSMDVGVPADEMERIALMLKRVDEQGTR